MQVGEARKQPGTCSVAPHKQTPVNVPGQERNGNAAPRAGRRTSGRNPVRHVMYNSLHISVGPTGGGGARRQPYHERLTIDPCCTGHLAHQRERQVLRRVRQRCARARQLPRPCPRIFSEFDVGCHRSLVCPAQTHRAHTHLATGSRVRCLGDVTGAHVSCAHCTRTSRN